MATTSTRTGKPSQAPAPAARGGKQLPTRQRRPMLMLTGALIVAVCALAGGVLQARSGDKVPVLVVQRPVAAGQVLKAADLGEARVAGLPNAMPASQRSSVVGKRAATNLVKGQVMTSGLVTATEVPKPGEALVGITAKPGQLPAGGLQPGDLVNAVLAPAGDGEAETSSSSSTKEPTVLATRAAVFESRNDAASGATVVTLLVAERDAAALSTYGASGKVALVKVNKTPGEKP